MSTAEDLLLAIEQNPDDDNAYLVLGDWLQSRADPRGELIALHYRLLRTPNDELLRRAADDLVQAHAAAFLGPLADRSAERLSLDWHLGFIRGVRLNADSAPDLRDLLQLLIDHPSARYLQRLEISCPELEGRYSKNDYSPALEVLLTARRPQTLRELIVGHPGEATVPDAVREAFPGLQRDAAGLWDEVRASLAKLRLRVSFDEGRMPELVLRDPRLAVEVDPGRLLIGLKAEFNKYEDHGLTQAMKRLFTRESLDAFVLELVEQWDAMGETNGQKWCLGALGPLGGDRCAAYIGSHMLDWHNRRVEQVVWYLHAIGTDLAIAELHNLYSAGGLTAKSHQAGRVLRFLPEGLEAAVVRRAPVDPLPEARSRVNAGQVRWLSSLMTDGHRIGAPDLIRHVAQHALRLPLVQGLVWGQYGERGQIRQEELSRTFRIDERGRCLTAADEPFDLSPDADVGLVHPVELDTETLKAWRACLDRSGLKPKIRQIDRKVYSLTDAEVQAAALERFKERRVVFYPLKKRLEERGWLESGTDNHGGTGSFSRRTPRQDVTVVAALDQMGYLRQEVCVERVFAVLEDSGEEVPYALSEVNPILLSEAIRELAGAIGPGKRTRAASATAPAPSGGSGGADAPLPQTGKHPFAEAAKSGRSKCVVCREKIEKGAIRIGVERMIETPSFTKRGTAWIHAGCRDRCPELEGMDDLDQRLEGNSGGLWPPGEE